MHHSRNAFHGETHFLLKDKLCKTFFRGTCTNMWLSLQVWHLLNTNALVRGNRTPNPLITNQVLCQLSHISLRFHAFMRHRRLSRLATGAPFTHFIFWRQVFIFAFEFSFSHTSPPSIYNDSIAFFAIPSCPFSCYCKLGLLRNIPPATLFDCFF